MAKTEYPSSPYIEERSPYLERIEKLLNEDYGRFFSLGAAMAGNDDDGQDIVQEVLVHVLEMKDKPADFMDDPVRYLCGAIINESREFFRKRKRRRINYNVRVEDFDRPMLEPMPDDPMIERLRKAMEQLDPYWSELLMLRYAGELTPAEIAVKVGLSKSAVSVELFRARGKVKLLMTDPNSRRGQGRPGKIVEKLVKAGRKISEILNDPGR